MDSRTSIFVDSGAHSLHTQKGKSLDTNFTETDAFWDYVNDYGKFIVANKHLIDIYVSVDIVFNPELSWKVQKYLETEYGLTPMPVFHACEDFKWFKKYLDNYEYIGVGGLGQTVTKAHWVRELGDPIFSLICKPPHYLPTHKMHGFAMTSPSLLAAYPWYSVDSTSWIQFGKYGVIIIPRKKHGKYDYTASPYLTFITSRPGKKADVNHFDNFVGVHQGYFYEYFAEKGFVVGSSSFRTIDPVGYKLQPGEHWAVRKEGLVETIIEPGISNSHELRDQLNLQFYLDLEAQIPAWPHPWAKKIKNTRLFD